MMMRWLAILLAAVPAAVPAAECGARSDATLPVLIELYTSEGCSSCPPADRWLSSFAATDSKRVIPLAFHIHYWDYIGWKDRFADPRYTERQRALAGARSAYTPQVVLAGRDFLGWRDERGVADAIAAANRKAPRARLELAARPTPEGGMEGMASAELAAGVKPDDLSLFVAVSQNGLASGVTAGENRGKKLSHNFVVRDFAAIRDLHGTKPTVLGGKFAFKPRPDWNIRAMSVVAFVQDTKTGEILQALSATPCPS